MVTRTLHCRSLESLQELATQLSHRPQIVHANIHLVGELGAGKSTFTRFLLQALGVKGTIKSPTYAVVEEYLVSQGAQNLSIWHFDFYRFNDPAEWEDAGFRDIFLSPGLKVSEWPDKALGYLPSADLIVELKFQDNDSRLITLSAPSALGAELMGALALGDSITCVDASLDALLNPRIDPNSVQRN
jgi:tRNA threonylcarbamoyladenosine biosynthesis protein TsaE